MQPSRLEIVGEFLAIKWDDDTESVISLERLRRGCPCAHCAGETDITGRVHRVGTPTPLGDRSFQLTAMERVGGYAVALCWADGHQTGIYSWDLLRRLAEGEDADD
jgi:DUF971 family protein